MFFKPETNDVKQTNVVAKTIKVHSLPYKNCFTNEAKKSDDKISFCKFNTDFINKCKADKKKFENVIILNGSDRQSHTVDQQYVKSNPKLGSCFDALNLLCQEANVKFDTFMMADIYGNKIPGTSYTEIMKGIDNMHSHCVQDNDHIILLYAQMHKIASENSNAIIKFDFYDNDIERALRNCMKFYSLHESLIPSNVELNFIYKSTTSFSLLNVIAGKPENYLDLKYAETVKKIVMKTTLGKLAAIDKDGNINPYLTVMPHSIVFKDFFDKLEIERFKQKQMTKKFKM